MRTLFISLFFGCVLSAAEEIPSVSREYDPAKWPETSLNLDQAGTFKNIFDSGLRPYRYPRLESSFLEVKHFRLRTTLASGKKLPVLSVEKMEISPFDDGEISAIEGFTPKLSLPDAKAEMLKWLPFGERTEQDLNSFLGAVEADYMDFDDPYRGRADGCATGWKEPGWKEKDGGPQCTVWFRKTASHDNPLRLHFKMSWSLNRPSKDRKAYRIPIPPPPGYEHVSMTAPANFGPDSAAEILQARGAIDSSPSVEQDQVPAGGDESTRQNQQSENQTGTNTPGQRREKQIKTWGWLVLVLLVSVAGILAFFVGRKPR